MSSHLILQSSSYELFLFYFIFFKRQYSISNLQNSQMPSVVTATSQLSLILWRRGAAAAVP